MGTEKSCLKCVCYPVCSKIALDLQMREKWNSNNHNNSCGKPEKFFEFAASECEFFTEGGKIIERKEVLLSTVNGS